MSQLGHNRERRVRHLLESDGWWVARAAGSLGDADLVACRSHPLITHLSAAEVMLVEVKANKDGGPYKNFGPVARRELVEAAQKAGGEAWLCYFPPRGQPQWLSEDEWPEAEVAT